LPPPRPQKTGFPCASGILPAARRPVNPPRDLPVARGAFLDPPAPPPLYFTRERGFSGRDGEGLERVVCHAG